MTTSSVVAQDRQFELVDFKIEFDNNSLSKNDTLFVIQDLEPRAFQIYSNTDITYYIEFKFKVDGERIKVRRKSWLLDAQGNTIKGNTKKEVQFMKASAPGVFEFPVAENIVVDKTNFKTFFISYRTKVTYK